MSGQQRVGIAGVTHRQLVYFHGIPGSALELSLVADFQPPDTQVFAPDRCADSPDLDFQAYCDVLAARIIWMFPSDPIDLVGFSLGARLAIELGIRLGDRIGAVDLIAPAAPPECGVALADMAGGAVFRLARDAPRRFASVSDARVPALAIGASVVAGMAVVLTSIVSPDKVFVFLLQSSGAIILNVYLLIALAQIALRRKMEAAGEALGVKVWLFPWVSYLLVGGIVAVLALMASLPDQREQVGLCALIFGGALLAYRLKRGAPLAR